MLQPKKTKHRKWHKKAGHKKGKAGKGSTLVFGSFGIKALTGGRMTSRQIEAMRINIVRYLKRGGKIWVRVFPDKPITKKPVEVGMGKGKGSVEYYAVFIRPGRILLELEGVDEATAREAIRRANYKLPFKTKFVKK
ncbi:MAG: 50S ribosomal protein L16 [bacterium]